MSETDTTPCPMCGHATMGYTRWAQLPTPRRARRRLHGLCTACARNGQAHTPTSTGPRATPKEQVSRELVLTDWHWLHETGELDPQDSLAHRVRLAAPRIGMSYAALEKALERAGITNPAEPSGLPKRGTGLHDCQQCRNNNLTTGDAERNLRDLAKRLAADPDSPKLRTLLEQARATLAKSQADRDAHLEWDHTDTEVVAA